MCVYLCVFVSLCVFTFVYLLLHTFRRCERGKYILYATILGGKLLSLTCVIVTEAACLKNFKPPRNF